MPAYPKKPRPEILPELCFDGPGKIAQFDRYEATMRANYRGIKCVYVIHFPLPRHFKRIMGTDRGNVVEIGRSSDLGLKMIRFFGAIRHSHVHDSEGWSFGYYRKMYEPLRELFPTEREFMDNVMFTFFEMPFKYHGRMECNFIDNYCSVLGEPPLLNNQVPGVKGKYKQWHAEAIPRPPLGAYHPKIPPGTICLADPIPEFLHRCPVNYSIFVMDPRHPGRRLPIERYLETDQNGELARGKTTNAARRTITIRNAILGAMHSDEWALFHHIYDICPEYEKVMGPRKEVLRYLHMQYRWTHPSCLAINEKRDFEDYIGRLGELPPMNCQLPGTIQAR